MMLGLDRDRCRRRGARSGMYRRYRRRGSDPNPAPTPARVRKGMREGAAREWRGSQAVVPMCLARVQTGWQRGLGFGAGGETVRLV